MVSKGQIHIELGKIFRCIQNLIKSDDEFRLQIDIFRKKTQRRINRIKIHSICISIHGEIKEQNKKKKFDRKERENDLI